MLSKSKAGVSQIAYLGGEAKLHCFAFLLSYKKNKKNKIFGAFPSLHSFLSTFCKVWSIFIYVIPLLVLSLAVHPHLSKRNV